MKTPTARTTTTSFFDTKSNLWLDAFLARRGVILTMMTMATTTTKTRGDSDDNDDGNNNHKDNDNDDARTTSTSFMTQQPTCGRMHSWKGGWGDFKDNGDDDKITAAR